MPERKDKSLEELQKDRLQAEINKLKAEIKKLDLDRREVKEKRVNQKWELASRIVASLFAVVVIVAAVVSIIIPLTQTSNQLAENKIRLAETKLDSAVFAKAQAETTATRFREKARNIATRLYSIIQHQKVERDSIEAHLEKEKSKSEQDRRKIRGLESQLKSKDSQISKIEEDTKKIENVIKPLVEVTFVFYDFDFQTPRFKIFLNDTLKATTTKHKYILKVKEDIYNLEIQYTDNANNIWECNQNININLSSPRINIYKSEFELIR